MTELLGVGDSVLFCFHGNGSKLYRGDIVEAIGVAFGSILEVKRGGETIFTSNCTAELIDLEYVVFGPSNIERPTYLPHWRAQRCYKQRKSELIRVFPRVFWGKLKAIERVTNP